MMIVRRRRETAVGRHARKIGDRRHAMRTAAHATVTTKIAARKAGVQKIMGSKVMVRVSVDLAAASVEVASVRVASAEDVVAVTARLEVQ
jgi:hypothetical protein